MAKRPYSDVLERLTGAGLRPTRQRLALARLLFEREHHHVTADGLHGEAQAAGVQVSLATVYNALHQFTAAHLLREVVVDSGVTYFDTNTADHYHVYFEDEGRLVDVDGGETDLRRLTSAPEGTRVTRVDVVVRVRQDWH